MAAGLWLAAITLHDVVEGVRLFGDLQGKNRNHRITTSMFGFLKRQRENETPGFCNPGGGLERTSPARLLPENADFL